MKAIISVSNKDGVVDFARELAKLGFELYSTGGTKQKLNEAGVLAASISKLSGFPEILDGRVKTLHPAVHGGILARRDIPEHLTQLAEHKIDLIDMVVVNLYPFAQTVARPEASLIDALENIDIGGPTMIRAAAKNFQSVIVVVDPADYALVLEELKVKNGVQEETRRKLATKAFQHTATYDTHIAAYLRRTDESFPDSLTIAIEKIQDLRYGENPHQAAAFYAESTLASRAATLAGARQLHGKALSFTNTLDLEAAFNCVRDFGSMAVAIVKHGNPCGLACGDDLLDTYSRALAGDPVSAFGGAIGLNRVMDEPTAKEIAQSYFEDIVAAGYTPIALEILKGKKDIRLLEMDFARNLPMSPWPATSWDFKRVSGGFLVQTPDAEAEDDLTLKVVSEREPTLDELTDLVFAWRAVKHVKSNAIALAKRLALVGVGAGQMSRVDSVEIAVRKAGARAIGSVLASDAFFPKPDGVEAAIEAGVTAIIQPGGSIRDEDIIRIVNKHHIAMIFTGRRHFKH